ncbi:MAG: hypothetical protein H6631_15500 [Anaerolineaceae bacterium]|nr:hypothetical protein [Anaerolineaceae bacterium]MCB9098965.1 hypothetical protein [Anaerolineales bacterium]
MNEYYNLKNIRDLLKQGFSERELRDDLCFYEVDFQPLRDQLPQNAGKDVVVQAILDFALQKIKVERLLEWVKHHNEARYNNHGPYFQPPEAPNKVAYNFLLALEDNHLGHGITLRGTYRGIDLKVAAIDWAEYGTLGKVRSGWLYVPQLTASHSVAFFKLHLRDDGTGYIHLVDVASPVHPIWLETQAGYKNKQYFHYDGQGAKAFDWWEFRWK